MDEQTYKYKQAVIDWVCKIPLHDLSDGKGFCKVIFSEDFQKALKDLPTAPQKVGHWIDCTSSEHMKCSVCGDKAPMYWDANRQEYDEWYSPFCPNCGADMREER